MGLFLNAEAMKDEIRKNITKRVYNVTDYYKSEGTWQYIARRVWFETLTLVVIAANAVWMGIDADNNTWDTLLESPKGFIIVENFFCVYFLVELFIRFMAFKRKLDTLKDSWFVFDSALVVFMIVETWVMMLVQAVAQSTKRGNGVGEEDTGGPVIDPSTLRLIRLLRLSRMARMARLFKAIPELKIMMKGLVAGLRPVSVTLTILTLVLYVFGVLFTQMARNTNIGFRYFNSVAESMGTLLLYGVFLEEFPTVFNAVGAESAIFGAFLLLFVLIGSFLVVNLLVGVMVETVRVVSTCEHESISIGNVRDKIMNMLDNSIGNRVAEGKISKSEFVALLAIPEAVRSLQELGVDVMGLVDVMNRVFEVEAALDFSAFMDLVLQLRGSNKATVKDIVYMIHFMREEFFALRNMVQEFVEEHVTRTEVTDKTAAAFMAMR